MRTMKFNPGFLSDDELAASFCVRTEEFDSIMEMLRECGTASNPHRLIVGPRGSGKTTLLLRVAAELRKNAELSRSFLPIIFAEESYSISSAGEFWLEALARLAGQTPGEQDRDELSATYNDIRQIRDESALCQRCLATILEFAERNDLRLVLIVENLNMIFSQLLDQQMEWRLRKILQTESRILLLASASSRFDEIDNPERAFFDLFVTHTLHPLNPKQCATLWCRVSGKNRDSQSMGGIKVLTGGSPRFVAILAQFGVDMSFNSLLFDLHDLIDDLTEYFRNQIENLPPQERRVYIALLKAWEPLTASQVADLSRMETNKSSALLNRMIERGMVEVIGGQPRKKLYQVAERLYNIYYLLRVSNTPHPLVEALIRFIDEFYSRAELEVIGTRLIQEISKSEAGTEKFMIESLKKFLSLPKLDNFLEEKYFHVKEHLPHDLEVEVDISVATAMSKKVDLLLNQNKFEESLKVSNKLIQKFSNSRNVSIGLMIANALHSKFKVCLNLGRLQDLLKACEDAIDQFQNFDEPVFSYGLIASSLSVKSHTLELLGKKEQAVSVINDFLKIVVSDEYSKLADRTKQIDLEMVVGDALLKKGEILRSTGKDLESVEIFEEISNRFGDSTNPEVAKIVAEALDNMMYVYFHQNFLKQSLATCEELTFHANKSKDNSLIEFSAKSMVTKGLILSKMNHDLEAENALKDALSSYQDYDQPNIQHISSVALLTLAKMECDKGNTKFAIKSTSSLIKKMEIGAIDQNCETFYVRATAYLDSGNLIQAEKDIETILSLLPNSSYLLKMITILLIDFSLIKGLSYVNELVNCSPSSTLLRPLTVALELEAGTKPLVAKEIEEVAEDIRKEIRERQNTKLAK